jgi:peptidoglycan hydrolase-like protein with peptidoglycan-binding domain
MPRFARPGGLAAALTVAAAVLLAAGCGSQANRATATSSTSTTATGTSSAATVPSSTPTPTVTTSASPGSKPKPAPSQTQPAALMGRGDSGTKVRELQHRLRQLDWYSGLISGRYLESTVIGVKGFQQKRNLGVNGAVDAITWSRLVAMTRAPSDAELHNRLVPGPALLESGSTGAQVRDLQARLRQLAWYSGRITGSYGIVTATGVRGFQEKRAIPVTGEVDQRTLDRLRAMTRTPTSDELNNRTPKSTATKASTAGLDPRCLTGRAMCISKRTDSLVWAVDGKPLLRVDVRFGAYETPTRNGQFSVGWKSRTWVSTIYHTSMPYAMFFSGGQAVHYSFDFAARGYAGASHGCVNVRNLSGIQWLFGQVQVGDKVIVYR